MMDVSALLRLVDTYCDAAGLAEATVSSRLFNDGKRIGEVRNGSDIGIRRVSKAVQWLSENWPDGAPWPDDIRRPAVQVGEMS